MTCSERRGEGMRILVYRFGMLKIFGVSPQDMIDLPTLSPISALRSSIATAQWYPYPQREESSLIQHASVSVFASHTLRPRVKVPCTYCFPNVRVKIFFLISIFPSNVVKLKTDLYASMFQIKGVQS